ncbi:ryncolin-1-like [Oculina patagonica]
MKKQLTQVQDAVKGQNHRTETLFQEMKINLLQYLIIFVIIDFTIFSSTAQNCAELYKSGQRISGVYTIDPDGSGAFDVFCDQTTAGGGWTVFQKRLNGSVGFYRGWTDYKRGFGNLNGEFWLGLDKIHRLTKTTKNRLRVDLEDTAGKTAYAEYDMFAVAGEGTKYQLRLGTYSGTAGDSLSYHRGASFSTKDQDNDTKPSGNCAVRYKGAWWFKYCFHSSLNGLYHRTNPSPGGTGVNWEHWKGNTYSLKRTEMKIRPVHF